MCKQSLHLFATECPILNPSRFKAFVFQGMNLISWCLSIYKLKTVSSDRASPSTREAIAGMLSFSQQSYSTSSSSPAKSSRSTKSQQDDDEDDDDDDQSIENIDKVHQDDDFSTYIIRTNNAT